MKLKDAVFDRCASEMDLRISYTVSTGLSLTVIIIELRRVDCHQGIRAAGVEGRHILNMILSVSR